MRMFLVHTFEFSGGKTTHRGKVGTSKNAAEAARDSYLVSLAYKRSGSSKDLKDLKVKIVSTEAYELDEG